MQTFATRHRSTAGEKLDERRANTRKLMQETAFITNSADTGWLPITVLDISINGISFACSRILLSGHSHSLRFTLPGNPKLQFAKAVLLPRTTEGVSSGYRYSAWFARIDLATVECIGEFVRNLG